jgi:RNA polymerase sigma-70 factor (ECF subfamily)
VRQDRPRFDADPAARRALLDRFLAAAEAGDVDGLTTLLAQDVVLYGDGGGIAPSPVQPVRGAAAVAAFLVEIAASAGPSAPSGWSTSTSTASPAGCSAPRTAGSGTSSPST